MPADALAVLDAVPDALVPAAIVRLAGRAMQAPRAATEPPDALLTPQEAAALLRADVRFVYRHARELGAVRLSRRKLRLSRKRIMRWLDGRARG